MHTGLRNVCKQVCLVCKAQPLSVPGLVVEIAGSGHGMFKCGFACGLSDPGTVGQLVATLVLEASAATVDDDFTVTQADGLWLAGWQQVQPEQGSPTCRWLIRVSLTWADCGCSLGSAGHSAGFPRSRHDDHWVITVWAYADCTKQNTVERDATTVLGCWWPRAESNHRHADFQR